MKKFTRSRARAPVNSKSCSVNLWLVLLVVLLGIIILVSVLKPLWNPGCACGRGCGRGLGCRIARMRLLEGYEGYETIENMQNEPQNDDSASNMNSNTPSFVMFYAPWCGYCKRAMPDFDNLINQYKNNSKVKVFKVNADENKELAQKEGVNGYPTIRFYPRGGNGGNPIDYAEDRSLSAMNKYLQGVI